MSAEQTIRRGVRNARYATIPNHVFEDDRLSMEARWLLGYLLSKPDNWTVVIGDITKRGKCGRDKARKMIAELVELGYAEREQVRDEGKFGASVLVIYDEPTDMQTPERTAESESVAFLPQPEMPATAKPSPVPPSPVKSALSNNSDSENTDCYQEREGARERDDRDREEDPKQLEARFDALMIGRHGNPWPGVLQKSKRWAFQQFLALTPEQRKRAEDRRDAYLASCPKVQRGERKGQPDAAILGIYLRDRLFDVMEAVAPKRVVEAVTIAPFGPIWAAKRFVSLLRGPSGVVMPDDPFEAVRSTYATLARGSETRAAHYLAGKGISIDEVSGDLLFPENFEADEYRRRVLKDGYPEVSKLDEAAKHRQSVRGREDDRLLGQLCEAVPVTSETFERWKAVFAERGWPWLPDFGQMPVAYFPKGGPDGLADFDAHAQDILQHGRSEAAE